MINASREDAKVRQIRSAARALFLQHGFAGVSTAAIAERAGVSKETLYSRFPSKEAVLADVLRYMISAGQERDHPIPELTTRAELEFALSEFVRELGAQLMQRDYLELARLVIAETPRLPHLGEVFRRSVPERALTRAETLLRTARHAGLIGEFDDTAAAHMLIGPVVIQILLHGLLTAPSQRDATKPTAVTGSHVALFLAALSSPRKEQP